MAETPAPAATAPPASPPATPPGADPDGEARLFEKIEAKVRAMFAEAQQPSPPVAAAAPAAPAAAATPAPPAPGGDPSLDERIAAAVRSALSERDKDDQLFVLGEEIKNLKKLATGPKAAGWAKVLFGPWG